MIVDLPDPDGPHSTKGLAIAEVEGVKDLVWIKMKVAKVLV